MTELEPVAAAVRKIICRYTEGHPTKRVLHKGEDVLLVNEVITLSSAQSAIAERDARIAELEAALDEKEIASGLTDNGSLWRFWSSRAKDVAAKLAAAIARAEAAEALLKEAKTVLEPFAEEAERYEPDEGDGDDSAWIVPAYFKIRHLRAARSLASKIGGGE